MPSGSSAKNYAENGDKWVIAGEIELKGEGVITKGGVPVVGGDGSGVDIPDGSITTVKLADGAVTDAKLANPKVDVPAGLSPMKVIGTSLSTSDLGMVGYSQSPMGDQLVMYQFGGQVATAAPVADTDAATKKYVDDGVGAATPADNSVTTAKIADQNVTVGKMAVNSVANAAIINGAVDNDKLHADLQGVISGKLTATQGAAVADASGNAEAQLNALLVSLRAANIIAT